MRKLKLTTPYIHHIYHRPHHFVRRSEGGDEDAHNNVLNELEERNGVCNQTHDKNWTSSHQSVDMFFFSNCETCLQFQRMVRRSKFKTESLVREEEEEDDDEST